MSAPPSDGLEAARQKRLRDQDVSFFSPDGVNTNFSFADECSCRSFGKAFDDRDSFGNSKTRQNNSLHGDVIDEKLFTHIVFSLFHIKNFGTKRCIGNRLERKNVTLDSAGQSPVSTLTGVLGVLADRHNRLIFSSSSNHDVALISKVQKVCLKLSFHQLG